MDLLTLAQNRVALKKKSAKEWAGPCPGCGGEDRFLVWPDKGKFHCRQCKKTGDVVAFLREFYDMSCPDAHEAVGRGCSNMACPFWDKCRLGAAANGGRPSAQRKQESLSVPLPPEPAEFRPGTAETPEEKWRKQAAALIEKSHKRLLDCPEQLAYLAGRGLPIEAVREYKLGLIPGDRWPKREDWGLESVYKEGGKLKKYFIPTGILIPYFDQKGESHRIRIRRFKPSTPNQRYFWLKGSGNDVPVLGDQNARGVVVVESDLDGFMVLWQCQGLYICTIPLGSVDVKPKGWAFSVLEKAKAILVALDFEPRVNEKTGKNENPGGKSSIWWKRQFKRAKRWPVPVGKDPGEYFEQGGDIRAWILEGLPPVFKLPKVEHKKSPSENKVVHVDDRMPDPEYIEGKTANGYPYIIAVNPGDVQRLQKKFPEHVVFTPKEIGHLKGMSKEEAELILLAKREFAGYIMDTRELMPGEYETLGQIPLPPEPEGVQDNLW